MSSPMLRSLGRNALEPAMLREMVRKGVQRVVGTARSRDAPAARRWASDQATSVEDLACSIDPELWQRNLEWAAAFKSRSSERLRAVPHDLGGGGHYPLLRFVALLRRPRVVVETGVAAGWSSAALLSGLAEGGGDGRLYSSDLPYFRLPDPERFVGWVVPDDLRDRWTLDVRGDRVALPRFRQLVGRIDVVHYDSDKTAAGRTFAWTTLKDALAVDSLFIWDDVQDNFHYRDLVDDLGVEPQVLEFEGKYVGLVGDLTARPA